MSRPRARQPDHDDGRGDLDLEDLGAAAHEVLDEQPARQQADRSLLDRKPSERTESGVGFDRVDHCAQAGQEVDRAEVVTARAAAGFVDESPLVEVDIERGDVVERRLLLRSEARRA